MLVTDRLFLRQMTAEDVSQSYVDWLNDPEINRYMEVRYTRQTISSCRKFVDQNNALPTSHLYGIFTQTDQQFIGTTKISNINDRHKTAHVGLFLGDKSNWGKGLAKESLKAITDFGFNEIGLLKLQAGCYEENLASLHVFLKCGYTVESFARKQFIWNGVQTGSFMVAAFADEWYPR